MVMEFESIVIKSIVAGSKASARVNLIFMSLSDANESGYYPAESVSVVSRSPENLRSLAVAIGDLADELEKEQDVKKDEDDDLPF